MVRRAGTPLPSEEQPHQKAAKLFACVPCAKRKVRCDRGFPCSNCKRRKTEICIFPEDSKQTEAQWQSPGSQLDVNYVEKIRNLEDHIRALGGNPYAAHQSSATKARDRGVSATSASNDTSIDSRAVSDQARLIEYDKHSVYMETPVWYGFRDAISADDHAQQAAPANDKQHQHATGQHQNSSLVLFNSLYRGQLYDSLPTDETMWRLWNVFKQSVHPIVKLFFAWEKELLVEKATKTQSTDRVRLTELALLYAIFFIAVRSLSEAECLSISNESKVVLLDRYQSMTEASLQASNFIGTTELIVLQAFVLYLLAMHTRGNPNTNYSLMGIALRIAERLGLQKDGDCLGLTPYEVEARRRVWWQMQSLDITLSQLTGCISLHLYADWDTLLPANLEDDDFRPEFKTLRQEQRGLTSMSDCLYRYHILEYQRQLRSNGAREGLKWLLSPEVSLAAKDRRIDQLEAHLQEKFLQYCEPLDPLQLHIQIGARSFILAARRTARQPRLFNAKISDMTRKEREDLLAVCIKGLEYNVLGATTESIKHFSWHNEYFFQWVAFVFVVIETRYRYKEQDVDRLWQLLGKVYGAFPKLGTEFHRPEIRSIGKLVLTSWRCYEEHRQKSDTGPLESLSEVQTPNFVRDLRERLKDETPSKAAENLPSNSGYSANPVSNAFGGTLNASVDLDVYGQDFLLSDSALPNFDYIDWSFIDNIGSFTSS